MTNKMTTGLLWYDDNPQTNLAEKVNRAARWYKQKYGTSPNVCYVHPFALPADGKVKMVGDVRVSSRRTVLPHHFFVCREDAPVGAPTQGRLP